MTTKTAVNLTLQQIGHEGLDGIKVSAPSAVQLFDHMQLADFDTQLRYRVLAEIRRQNLVDITQSSQYFLLHLTVKGIHRLQRAQVEQVTIPRPDKWDKVWRMVTYDVPRAQSAQRRLFARQLDRLGFTMLRESVWLHPYPCFEAVEEIIGYCGLQRHVTLAEISRIDNISLSKLKQKYPEL